MYWPTQKYDHLPIISHKVLKMMSFKPFIYCLVLEARYFSILFLYFKVVLLCYIHNLTVNSSKAFMPNMLKRQAH